MTVTPVSPSPLWGHPEVWGHPTDSDSDSDTVPTALSHLRTYRVLSWLLMVTVAVATLVLLAVKVWPR